MRQVTLEGLAKYRIPPCSPRCCIGGRTYSFTCIEEVLLYDSRTVHAFGKNVQHFVAL